MELSCDIVIQTAMHQNVIHYLLFLIITVSSTAGSYFLHKKHKSPFLSDYFVLIALSNAWGFIIWIMPDFISHLSKLEVHSTQTTSLVMILLKWFAFPINVFHAFFLILFLTHLVGKKIGNKLTFIYFAGSFLLTFYLLILLISDFPYQISPLFYCSARLVTYLFLFLEMGVLATFLILSRKEKLENAGICRAFTALSLLLYILYLFISSHFSPFIKLVAKSDMALSTYCFYALWFIPTILIYRRFSRSKSDLHKASLPNHEIFAALNSYKLTNREKELAVLIFQGLSNQDIEDRLYLSRQTIKNYISGLYRKLDISSRLDLIRLIRSKCNRPTF